MKAMIGVFSELGERLRRFGDDPSTDRIAREACAANAWFSPAEVRRAVRTIGEDMLRRERLEAWLAHYPAVPVARPRRVLVVMAGNIPLVGFLDLLCVLVSGHACAVKPSAKDTVLAEFVLEQLRAIEPHIPVAIYDGSPVDAVIATGGDNAVRHFRARFGGLPMLLRGSRQSVAVLSGRETAEQSEALSDDIWAYSGLGCRNVSLVFLPEGCELRLQPPAMNEKYRRNYLQTRALLTLAGRPFRDLGAAVAVEQRELPASLSQISYTYYRSAEEVEAWLADQDDRLQCVVAECIDHPRRVGFGRAQSPSLTDYPDDRDVISFLAGLDG